MNEFVNPYTNICPIMAENHDTFHNPKWYQNIALNLPTSFALHGNDIVVTAILPNGTTFEFKTSIPTSHYQQLCKEIHTINGELS